MPEVTLAEVLSAREHRAETQRQLLSSYRFPLLCFTMNIAGPRKTSPLIERGFRSGLDCLEASLPSDAVLFRHVDILPTGCEAYFVVNMPAEKLKLIGTSIEENNALGRLFDMDVLDETGNKLERREQRGCLVCGAPGRACAAGRRHTVEELQAVTAQILTEHFSQSDEDYLAEFVTKSLLFEVNTTPKPGLVDRRNSGSHTDMSLDTFVKSAEALKPYFAACFRIGRTTVSEKPSTTFSALREAGVQAEKSMYAATGGVNTHKGAIYSFGILCGALGRLWDSSTPFASQDVLAAECRALCAEAVVADLATADESTAGLRCYRKHGITGIRGEVLGGFPSVTTYALPAFANAKKDGLSDEDAGVTALLHLIAHVQDTALLHRGGTEGAVYAAEAAKRLLRTPYPSHAEVEALDEEFIKRNLSPGGCADLLAVTYFLYYLL